MRIAPDQYEEYKTFFAWMCRHVLHVDSVADASPLAALDQLERQSMSKARSGLGMAIADIVEDTRRVAPDLVREIDAALGAKSLPTLSQMRARFDRAVRKILSRGSVRVETEYYTLRGAVEDLPEAERAATLKMLSEFEQRVTSRDLSAPSSKRVDL